MHAITVIRKYICYGRNVRLMLVILTYLLCLGLQWTDFQNSFTRKCPLLLFFAIAIILLEICTRTVSDIQLKTGTVDYICLSISHKFFYLTLHALLPFKILTFTTKSCETKFVLK